MTDEIAAANKGLVRRFYKLEYGAAGPACVTSVHISRLATRRPNRSAGVPGLLFSHTVSDTGRPIRSHDLIAEGDRVVVRWRLLGTHKGDFRGIAPTGRAIALKGIAIYRVEGGKLMERWVVSDLHGLLEEIRGSSTHRSG